MDWFLSERYDLNQEREVWLLLFHVEKMSLAIFRSAVHLDSATVCREIVHNSKMYNFQISYISAPLTWTVYYVCL